MKEFMLFIKATGNPIGNLPMDKQQEHIQKVGLYIQDLVSNGKLKNAQPLEPNGIILSNKGGSFTEAAVNVNEEIIAGFYHLAAEDIIEVVRIAQTDPRFNDGEWTMEIRPIMSIEGIN